MQYIQPTQVSSILRRADVSELDAYACTSFERRASGTKKSGCIDQYFGSLPSAYPRNRQIITRLPTLNGCVLVLPGDDDEHLLRST